MFEMLRLKKNNVRLVFFLFSAISSKVIPFLLLHGLTSLISD